MSEVRMTNHSIKRTKERLGLSKKIADKNAMKALEFGITHAEARGNLKKFMDKLYLSCGKANNMRVYHHHVYCFQGTCLITVINLPNNLCKLADRIQGEKENKSECELDS
ncbi:MAG: hypothetical protein NC218_07220 [Acetobacter sp.]|nr:hypothetical protein [Acetobacter sp.]